MQNETKPKILAIKVHSAGKKGKEYRVRHRLEPDGVEDRIIVGDSGRIHTRWIDGEFIYIHCKNRSCNNQ